jgi:hypothetical protein
VQEAPGAQTLHDDAQLLPVLPILHVDSQAYPAKKEQTCVSLTKLKPMTREISLKIFSCLTTSVIFLQLVKV